MTDADWNAALREVVATRDISGLVVFPGMALAGSRGETLRTMVRAWR
jgi:hypothetical protein